MSPSLRRARIGVLAAAALAAGFAAYAPSSVAAPPARTGASASTAFRFNPGLPLLNDKGANTGAAEPSIAVDTPGNVYVSAPVGVPTGGCPFWTVHPGSLNAKGKAYEYRGTIDTDHGGVGGGDCDISTGTRSTLEPNSDSISVSSLSLANLTTNTSQDRGKTFKRVADPFGQQVFGVDRQWQAADRNLKTYYLTVHDLAVANIQVAVSIDGGYQYVSNSMAITNALPAAQNNNHFGTVVVDPKTHKLYIPFIANANAEENAKANTTGPGNRHVAWVAVGDPCAVSCRPGLLPGPIKWTNYKVFTAPQNENIDHIFPAIAIDNGDATGAHKNVYIGWTGDTDSNNGIYLSSASVDNPSKWRTKPIRLDPGTNHSNMFPWLVAGKSGVVDAAWYAGRLTSSSGTKCPPGASGAKDDSQGKNNNCHNTWRVAFAQVTRAASSTPVVTRSYASGTMHNGSICDQGLNCSLFGGDRSLLDFFDMDLDPAGGANIAYVQDPSLVTYTRQCSGKSATTGLTLNRGCGGLQPPPPPPPGPTCGSGANHAANVVTDATGDAVNPTGAGNTGSTDARTVNLADAGSNIDVTLSVSNLQDPAVPPPGTTDVYYYATWLGPDGKQYGVRHIEPEAPGAKNYTVGQFDTGSNRLKSGTTSTVSGSYNAGSPGTIVWHVPKSKIGNPTVPVSTGNPAARGPYSVIIVGLGSSPTGGLVFIQPADRAPNSGFGADWAVCP
jgi:hypothetical protein